MTGLFESLGRIAIRNRLVVLALYLLVSVLLVWSATSIRLETSLAELLPPGTPSADDFRDLLEAEGSLDRLLISIGREPGETDPDDEAMALLDVAEALSESLEGSGLIRTARYGFAEGDLADLSRWTIRHLPVLADPESLDAIRRRLEPESIRESLGRIRRQAMLPASTGVSREISSIDPLGLAPLAWKLDRISRGGFKVDPGSGLFLSRNGRRLLLVLEATEPPTEIDFSRRLMAAVEKAESRIAEGSSHRLLFENAGGHLFALEDERRIRGDAATVSLFSLAAIAAIYLFVIRRPVLWLIVLVPLTMCTVWTLGLAAIYPGRLNMVTVAFAAILLGIGDDAMIHIYLREREERRRGRSAADSALMAIRATGPAVTVATLTSAAAFLSLSLVRFRGLSELGIIAAMGMGNLLVGVLFFFPAALAFLARRDEGGAGPPLRLPLGGILQVNRWARRRRGVVLAAAALLTAGMLTAALGVHVSTDLRSIRGEDPAAAGIRDLLRPFQEGSSAETMVVMHGARQGRSVVGDGSLEEGLLGARELEEFCREEIGSGRITGCDLPTLRFPPSSVQRSRHDALGSLPWKSAAARFVEEVERSGMDPAWFGPFVEAIRGYGTLEEVSIVPGEEAFGRLGVPATRIYFTEPADAPAIAAEIRQRLDRFPIRIASISLVSADLGRIIAGDFRLAGLLVVGAILVLSLAAFRGIRVLILTLTPVAVGTIWMLGSARIAGIELNLMSLMGMPVVFGLGIDFGVYLVDRWIRSGRDMESALSGAGPAILVTGLTTLAGFAALLTASLAGLRSLGFVVVAGAGFTLAAALLLLPLLIRAGGDPGKDAAPGR